jgi:hypothetical protein
VAIILYRRLNVSSLRSGVVTLGPTIPCIYVYANALDFTRFRSRWPPGILKTSFKISADQVTLISSGYPSSDTSEAKHPGVAKDVAEVGSPEVMRTLNLQCCIVEDRFSIFNTKVESRYEPYRSRY